MKTEDEIRADFKSAWQQGEWYNLHTNPADGFKIWQSCQQLNNDVIAAKDARIEELEAHMKELACKLFHECIPANLAKDAEIARLQNSLIDIIKEEHYFNDLKNRRVVNELLIRIRNIATKTLEGRV